MEFSQGFLSKLLESAVTYYNTDNDVYQLPDKHQSVESAIDSFSEALIFEAHKSMQQEITSHDLPILHAINLDSKNPGIIFAQTENKSKFKVHKKANPKPKKEKTQEQIEAELEKAAKRKQEQDAKKEEREKQKKLEKDEKEVLKQTKSVVKDLKKKTSKSGKIAKRLTQKATKANNRLSKKKNPSQELKDEVEQINNQAEEAMNEYKNLNQELEQLEEQVENKESEINQRKEKKIKEKENRMKAREEKKLKAQKKKEEKEKKIAEKIDENDMNIYDELFDLAMEAQNKIENSEDLDEQLENSEVTLDKVKLYESPLPYQRHINALELSQPNPALIPALLKGKAVEGDAFIKLFHGPPGTGKTYRLMQELLTLIDNKKHFKILVCAPSNIATINMYKRAVNLGIKGSLVISSNRVPEDLDLEENDIENHQVIFSTISMRFGSKLRNIDFSTILMDEAAQCQEAWVWGLLRPELKYIYMAGDPHQLPALVSDNGVSLNHGRSMMERLIELGYPSELLDTQRRMHPDIVAFSNARYYQGKLKTDYQGVDLDIEHIEIMDVDGQEERIGTSYSNIKEAESVIETYHELKEDFEDVIIISPYQAHINTLRELDPSLEIHTVDSFQGREADAVILSTVRTTNLGFWSDYRRLNVAMTRAKHVLRIIGNVNAWQKHQGPLKDLWDFFPINNDVEVSVI
jgi:superfamily I DNA and/or RNA helicase